MLSNEPRFCSSFSSWTTIDKRFMTLTFASRTLFLLRSLGRAAGLGRALGIPPVKGQRSSDRNRRQA